MRKGRGIQVFPRYSLDNYIVDIPITAPRLRRTKKLTKRPIIYIEIDYPVDKGYRFAFIRLGGFGKKDIALCVYQAYSEIYKHTRLYGVWGHSLADLTLDGIVYRGKGLFTLEISS